MAGMPRTYLVIQGETVSSRHAHNRNKYPKMGENVDNSIEHSSLKPDFHSHLSLVADAIFRYRKMSR